IAVACLSLVIIRTKKLKYKRLAFNATVPNLQKITCRTTVKVIGAIVCCQSIGLTIQRKTSIGNAVCKASDYGTKEGAVAKILFRQIMRRIIKAKRDFSRISILVWSYDACYCCTYTCYFDAGTFTILKFKMLDGRVSQILNLQFLYVHYSFV